MNHRILGDRSCQASQVLRRRSALFRRKRQKSRRSSGSNQSRRGLLVEASRSVVRMVNRLFDTQHRPETDVASLEQTTPMVARIAFEQVRKPCLKAVPLIAIVLRGWIDVVEL